MPKLAVSVSIRQTTSKPESQSTPSVELQQWPVEELWLTAWPTYVDGSPRLRLSSLAARIFKLPVGYPALRRTKEATSGNEEGQGRRLVWRQQHDRADCSRADLAR
jgi:hypothetical protein